MIKDGTVWGILFIAMIIVLVLAVYMPSVDASIDLTSIIVSILGG